MNQKQRIREYFEREGTPMKILVSACLLGENCKYNGGNNRNPELLRLLSGHTVIPVCPEVLGGLPVPRVPAEIVNGTVMNREGLSVDAAFRHGAEKALEIAEQEQPDWIILQSRSPSCGVKEIYDGSFSGRRIPGHGVFAGLALKAGFRVTDAEDFCSDSSLSVAVPFPDSETGAGVPAPEEEQACPREAEKNSRRA